MRWAQVYDPLGHPALSTLASALPVIVLLGALGVLRWRAHTAALAGLATALRWREFAEGRVEPWSCGRDACGREQRRPRRRKPHAADGTR